MPPKNKNKNTNKCAQTESLENLLKSPLTTAEIFKKAIKMPIPEHFWEKESISDHQANFINPDGNESLNIEILDEEHFDKDVFKAAEHYFHDLVESRLAQETGN